MIMPPTPGSRHRRLEAGVSLPSERTVYRRPLISLMSARSAAGQPQAGAVGDRHRAAGEMRAEDLVDAAQQPVTGRRWKLGYIRLAAFLGHPLRYVEHAGPPDHDGGAVLEEPGLRDALFAPVGVAVMAPVAGAGRLHQPLVGVEPGLAVRPGVAPPRRPVPARAEHPGHLPAGAVRIEPMPRLGETRKVNTSRTDRQRIA